MNNKLFKLTVSQSNRSSVFREIFDAVDISRQEIAEHLDLSLPTIRQPLNELLEMGIIREDGFYESTGGRKPSAFSVSPMSRIAVGVEFLGEYIQLSAVNLRGEIVLEERHDLLFYRDEKYYEEFGTIVNNFVSELKVPSSSVLEILIAVQGIVSVDGESIVMGKVLGNSGTKRTDFQKYINYPCRLVNDTEAAAFAELWSNPETANAAYILLNRNLGGSIIINGRVFNGRAVNNEVMNGGIIGHMRLVPGGKPCYCGKRGCFQTYCSVSTLEEESGMDIDSFMKSVNANDKKCLKIFDRYLSYLAFALNNMRNLMEYDFIIGGYLSEYLTDEHLEILSRKVQDEASFDNMSFIYRRSIHGARAPSRGAAYREINDFILSI